MNARLGQALQNCYGIMQSGELARAWEQIEAIIKSYPANSDAQHLTAMISLRRFDYPPALKHIQKALRSQPRHHEYLNTLGNIYSAMQSFPKARAAYEKSLRVNPQYLSAAQNLGAHLIETDDPERACAHYQSILDRFPDNEKIILGYATALRDRLRFDDALSLLDQARLSQPYLRGQNLCAAGRTKEGISAFRRALKIPREAGPALRNLLQQHWMNGEVDAAFRLADESIAKARPGPIIALCARSFERMGDMEKAVKTCETALSQTPAQPDLLSAFARLVLSTDPQKAHVLAMKAAENRPGDLELLANAAECALAAGHPEKSREIAETVRKRRPADQFWLSILDTANRALGLPSLFKSKHIQLYDVLAPNGYDNAAAFNAALAKALSNIHGLQAHPLDQSLRQGVQSPTDLRFHRDPAIQSFFKAIDTPIRDYIKKLGTNNAHPITSRNTGRYRLAGAWSVRLGAGGHHVAHVHPKGWISSAYYVQVPPETAAGNSQAGWLQFGKPPYPVNGRNGPLNAIKTVQPRAGMLALFPSCLWHNTVPLTQDAPRMTLPFDVVPD